MSTDEVPAMSDIIEMARDLATQLQEDIALSKNREEHIRVTARANAATDLANMLLSSTDQ